MKKIVIYIYKRINRLYSFIILFSLFLLSCQSDQSTSKAVEFEGQLFSIVPPSISNITFNNQITETEENHHLMWESIYNGGGVGIGDINNDGLQDVYLSGNMVEDKLYINKGNMQFEDISHTAGINEPSWSSGVNIIDINRDGFADIYVCKMSWYPDNQQAHLRKNKLYLNNGDLTFTEAAEEYGLADSGHSTMASFFDYNKDGYLDAYVMNAPSHRYDQKLVYMQQRNIPYEFSDHLYKGGPNGFEDITRQVLGNQDPAFGLGLATQDLNQDGWTDIYVANDFEKPDLYFENTKIGGYTSKLSSTFKHTSYSSMGLDVADINNDALPDIAVLDMQSNDHIRSKTNMPSMDTDQFWENVKKGYHFQYMSNALQLNNGKSFYSNIGQLSGMASTDWSWSILMPDLDNDGWNDAIITNGINRNIKDNDFNIMLQANEGKGKESLFEMSQKTKVEKVANFAFRNQGDLTFEDVSREWGFDLEGFSFGAGYADFDLDGDIDVIINNNNDVATLYKNNIDQHSNWLRVKPTKGNQLALNTKVYLSVNGQWRMGECHNVRGYQSTSEAIVHFGLGNIREIEELKVVFPSGKVVSKSNVRTNQVLKIDESEGRHIEWNPYEKKDPLLADISKEIGVEYYHVENKYNDFSQQVLRPHKVTSYGPNGSVGDVNGDGLDDVFIGGSAGDFGLIYLQTSSGRMQYFPNPEIESDKAFEDMGSVLVDIENDGDLDLFVLSGGSEFSAGHDLYQSRLYINDGKGKFIKSTQSLPSINGSNVCTIDINKDGFKDLFVGCRMEGNVYPKGGESLVLVNKNGTLEVSQKMGLGMINDMANIDFDTDGDEDIIAVGEWTRPMFLSNENGQLTDVTDDWLNDDLNGWWFDIEISDLDDDGKQEILLGNIGMNNKYHASVEKPLKVYADDFDNNNSSDIVLAKGYKGKEVPVRGFQCSSEQLPVLKSKFKSYNEFANAGIENIINVQDKTLQLIANEMRSGYLRLENGKYKFKPFPNQAQLSATMGMGVTDLDNDGKKDIIIVGNFFDTEVETERHDASVGCVLRQKSNLEFSPLAPFESGLYAPGDVKDILQFELKGKSAFLILNNNNITQTFVKK